MRVPWLYRRPARGWPDVRRELEAAGVPRVGVDSKAPARQQASASRGRTGAASPRFASHVLAGHGGEQVIDAETIEQAAHRLREAAPGTRLILFGAHAWASASAHSDLDFLVILPEPPTDAAAESVRLRRALRGMLLAADIFVVGAQSVRDWRGVPNSLIGAALAEGRELTP